MMLIALLLTIAPAVSAASAVDGIWIPSSLKQALESGQAGEMPCWIQVDGGEPPSIVEDCQGHKEAWGDVVQAVQRAGTREIEGRVADGGRRLVRRAGAPNELERVVLAEDGRPREVQRLYRLPPGGEERLAGWSATQRLLVHPFRTGDGARVEFRSDGTYRFAEESGRYEMEAWPLVEGAVGLLTLTSEGGKRQLWVVASGERLGLVPAQDGWELDRLRSRQSEVLAAARQDELAVEVDDDDLATGVPEADQHFPQKAIEETERKLDQMVDRIRAGQPSNEVISALGDTTGATAIPTSGSRALPILTIDPTAVTVWLEQNDVPAQEPTAVEVVEEPAEIPAIAQPIAPQRKGCGGCNSGGGMGGLALLPLLGLALRRPGKGHPGR